MKESEKYIAQINIYPVLRKSVKQHIGCVTFALSFWYDGYT